MFGRKKKRKEPLPWYRARNYKGNLTEAEKRELDSFRHRESEGGEHPSASYGDLPEEVQSYLSKIEIERYDLIQENLVSRCFLLSGVGLFLLLNHFGWISLKYDSTEVFLVGVFLLLAPWVYYPVKWRKNADQFSEHDGIRTEWELNYIVNKKMSDTSSI
jgi:hypothetical protein